ncbi:hypothetical protein [Blastopirellula marina]|uniref:Uncharacterized protein n=1 Tax=Blastopirellula marina TaxID=124 RepID=A0A2S8GLW0_9BACT|nr:hypothetical protein [Blastopirellula marina]PQO45422.1 hypothetical protein C5Y93_13300 [Blastopirellula marina]
MVPLDIGSVVIVHLKPILLVVGFGLTACHMLVCGLRFRSTHQFSIVIACFAGTILLLALLLGSWWFHHELRMVARSLGVYADRRPVQKVVTMLLLYGIPLGGLLGVTRIGQRHPFLAGVLAFSLWIVMLGAVRVVSYHPIDEIMVVRVVPGVSIFEVLIGIGLVGLNLCLIGCRKHPQTA